MENETEGDFSCLMNELAKLQSKWECRLTNLVERKEERWVRGVLFGIETGRASVGKDKRSSVAELSALLIKWERIRKHAQDYVAEDTIRGLDYGIRLVTFRVRRFLRRALEEGPERQESPTSTDSRKARSSKKVRRIWGVNGVFRYRFRSRRKRRL